MAAKSDITLIHRLRGGHLTTPAPALEMRPLIPSRLSVHQQLREELELMAWSINQPIRLAG